MIYVEAAGRRFEAALCVFDKDGLLFESERFWKELCRVRIAAFQRAFGSEYTEIWGKVMGARFNPADVEWVDPMGILAMASIPEEISVNAALLTEHMGLSWTDAQKAAGKIIGDCDKQIDFSRALMPRKGFPDIFHRLRKAGMPYCIATSDTRERTERSVNLFDDFSKLLMVVTPLDVIKGKPAPDMLTKISVRTGVSPQHIVMVGDSYVDTEMARNFGAIGIGVPESADMRRRMESSASAMVEDLDQIIVRRM